MNHPGFEDFVEDVRQRLDAGAREYGQQSFEREPADLVEEIRQELRDVAGWAYVLDQRLARIQAKARKLAAPPNDDDPLR